MASDYLYPLDLTGSQPSNTIRDEKHTISPPSQITQSSFIVLRACPFFAHNIVVKDGKGATARTLAFGEDYLLTHKSIALTMLTKKGVYASIQFKDRNYTGSVYVTYQTVGGEYNLDDYTIVEKLTRQKYIITHTSFDQLVGLPASFPNPPHQHDPTDLVGMAAVVEKLSDLAAAIRGNKGSFGLVNTLIHSHLNNITSHTPSQVGLGNLKNYALAVANDYDIKSSDKYTTPATVNDYVSKTMTIADAANSDRYLTKVDGDLLFVKASEVYNKAESNNLYHTKQYLDSNYLKKVDAVTTTEVGNIVNTIVDMSQYHTRVEALGVFYTRILADERFYTRSQIDTKFVTLSEGDVRYIQTTNPTAILSPRPNNQLIIESGQFYVGKEAPLAVSVLYIDCINGSDNSPGTRAEPLRTLEKANEITPANKSSTWFLRHYQTYQMGAANFWYNWNFNHKVLDGAKRNISIYGHTWIDGAKYSTATQQQDGVCNWWYLNEVEPLEIYLRGYDGPNGNKHLFGVDVDDHSEIILRGVTLLKPKALNPKPYNLNTLHDISFMSGNGTFRLIGVKLLQLGEFKDLDSDRFKWFSSTVYDNSTLVLDNCVYGYVTPGLTPAGLEILNIVTTGFYGYTLNNKPFHYEDTVGRLIVTKGNGIGDGATQAGGKLRESNARVVLQRTGMVAGLNVVNSVCTNIQSNITLVP